MLSPSRQAKPPSLIVKLKIGSGRPKRPRESTTTPSSPPPEKKEKLCSFLSDAEDRVIVVEIGSPPRSFYLYESILIRHSDLFKTILDEQANEVVKGVIRLHDIEPDTFDCFAEWAISGAITHPKADGVREKYGMCNEMTPASVHISMVKAYLLGDRLLAPKFRRQVHNNLVSALYLAHCKVTNYWDLITFVFNHVPEDRMILQLLVDQFRSERKEITKADLPPASFMRRVIHEYQERWPIPICSRCYQEHEDNEEEECCRYHWHMKWNAKTGYGDFA